jgi:hypothetical protein
MTSHEKLEFKPSEIENTSSGREGLIKQQKGGFKIQNLEHHPQQWGC